MNLDMIQTAKRLKHIPATVLRSTVQSSEEKPAAVRQSLLQIAPLDLQADFRWGQAFLSKRDITIDYLNLQ